MQNIGIPDLLCCVDGLFIGIEVKRPGKKATPAQALIIDRIRKAGGWADVATSASESLEVVALAISRRRRKTFVNDKPAEEAEAESGLFE